MLRRQFLKRLLQGTAAVAVTLAVPVDTLVCWLPGTENKRYLASEYLLRQYNALYKGKTSKERPQLITAQRDLFEMYEAEILPLQRFTYAEDLRTGHRSLMFKATRMVCADEPGYGAVFS